MSEKSFKVLATLMIMGAQSPEKALASDELARQFGIDGNLLDSEIETLNRGGYIETFIQNGMKRIYLSLSGIIAASSLYS